jgi:glycosyltransferase involved in cell wall biosynthesis
VDSSSETSVISNQIRFTGRTTPALPTTDVLVDVLKDRMKQLVVCLSNSWGGLEQVAANDAIDVASLGLDVTVLCLDGSPIHQALQSQAALLTPSQPKVKIFPIKFRPRNYLDFKMRNLIEQQMIDGVNLIHTHQTSLLGSLVPWLWKRPDVGLVASRHIMNNHSKRDLLHRAIYRRVDKLIVMSHTLRKNVMQTHALRERQVKVVSLGLDFDRFDPDKVNPDRQRQVWGADAETIVLGLVGRIDPAKGQGTFIKAAAGLMKHMSRGEKLKFVIVGEETLGNEGGHLEELKEMVRQFGLEENVVFAGYRENIPEVMRAFDIFVMPSRQEAFGLVAIEAMAMECPILISTGGSAEEIVGSPGAGEFGLTVRPDDAFDLQNQLRFLIDHPIERVQMGQRARQHVKANYDRQIRIQRTLNLYDRVLRIRGII